MLILPVKISVNFCAVCSLERLGVPTCRRMCLVIKAPLGLGHTDVTQASQLWRNPPHVLRNICHN